MSGPTLGAQVGAQQQGASWDTGPHVTTAPSLQVQSVDIAAFNKI